MKVENQNPNIKFETIRNTGDTQVMKQLIDLKNIFARQLPKMPKEYIIRLIFDQKHECLVIKKDDKIFGGLCYCMFPHTAMVEIVFLAIMSDHQIKGYGTKLMNELKTRLKKRNIHFLMTCADNLAIGYFTKQGFHKEIQMPEILYKGYLKDYEGSTLMECLLVEEINYHDIQNQIKEQRQLLTNFIKSKVSNSKICKGIPEETWKKLEKNPQKNQFNTLMNPLDIPGLKDVGYNLDKHNRLLQKPKGTSFYKSCEKILELLKQHKSSWPFKEPVKREEVPDYYDIIKEPIDFSKIGLNLKNGKYTTKQIFEKDVFLIFQNAKTYNQPHTIFYKYAVELEKFARDIFENLKDETLFKEIENKEEIESKGLKHNKKNKKKLKQLINKN